MTQLHSFDDWNLWTLHCLGSQHTCAALGKLQNSGKGYSEVFHTQFCILNCPWCLIIAYTNHSCKSNHTAHITHRGRWYLHPVLLNITIKYRAYCGLYFISYGLQFFVRSTFFETKLIKFIWDFRRTRVIVDLNETKLKSSTHSREEPNIRSQWYPYRIFGDESRG
jgi:hypothetical protein